MEDKEVINWSCEEVGEWLKKNNFHEYVTLLTKDHKIDGTALLELQEADLRQPPLEITVLGDIKRLSASIRKLQNEYGESKFQSGGDSLDGWYRRDDSIGQYNLSPRQNVRRMFSHETMSDDDGEVIEEEIQKFVNETGRYSKHLDPELFKTGLSFIYMFAVFLSTSFIMTIVHDRVPDPQKYPPLPDLFLDNIPYMPWAFQVCELCGVSMFFVWCCILFFHKHRFILMRRMFSMLGTIFLLRSVCMLITSLSVPGLHLQCTHKFGTLHEKLVRTYKIWSGFGMSIQGVESCGDYMFSGHTSCITLLNFFITEYVPHKLYFINTFTWVANFFAIFFILAAHEHYSIDVFIAFYITSRLFLYYHTLANNRSLMARDKKRRRVWFPLFSYFESKCDGIVPNVYEWPFPYPVSFVEYFEKKKKRKRY